MKNFYSLYGGEPVLDLSAIGHSSSLTTVFTPIAKLDLQSDAVLQGAAFPDAIILNVRTVNGQGEVPAAPEIGSKVQIFYAFSDQDLEFADTPSTADDPFAVLANRHTVFDHAVPASELADASGTRDSVTPRIPVTGRFLYLGYVTDVGNDDAFINCQVFLKAIA